MTSLTRVLAAAACAATACLSASLPAAAAPAANTLGGSTISGVSAGRCAPITSRKVAGTLLGADGLALNATIGFDFKDARGRAIDARTGCAASGYGAILQLNHYVSGKGAPVGSEMTSAQGTDEGPVDPSFAVLNLPANITTVYVETYTRNYTGSPCGLTCAGVPDTSKYGRVNRQQLPISRAGNLQLVADETPQAGGHDGAIQLYIHSTSVSDVHAWSMSIKGNLKDEGWGAGYQSSNRHLWTIPALSPGQEYTIIVGGYPQIYHIKVNKNRTTKIVTRF